MEQQIGELAIIYCIESDTRKGKNDTLWFLHLFHLLEITWYLFIVAMQE